MLANVYLGYHRRLMMMKNIDKENMRAWLKQEERQIPLYAFKSIRISLHQTSSDILFMTRTHEISSAAARSRGQ
jgi:5-methylthioribose kinase